MQAQEVADLRDLLRAQVQVLVEDPVEMADVQSQLARHQAVGIDRVVRLSPFVGREQQVAVIQRVDRLAHSIPYCSAPRANGPASSSRGTVNVARS